MNREDILRMAREAGIEFDHGWGTCFTGNVQIERFATLVAEHEREACAKICENFSDTDSYDGGITTDYHAILIRARGQA